MTAAASLRRQNLARLGSSRRAAELRCTAVRVAAAQRTDLTQSRAQTTTAMSRICASTWFWRPEAPTSCRVAAARPQTLASDIGIAFSWLLSPRRQALILLARQMAFPARPNVKLTGPVRWDGLARAGKMYRVPQAGPSWLAVAGPVFSDGLCPTRSAAGAWPSL